jgi:hypothetical protein
LIRWEPPLTWNQLSEMNNQAAVYSRTIEREPDPTLNQAANKRGPPESHYQVRQKVWLEAKNLPLQYRSIKLALKWHGPFEIIKEISLVTYQL